VVTVGLAPLEDSNLLDPLRGLRPNEVSVAYRHRPCEVRAGGNGALWA